jgi:hypothetical protein
MMPNQCFTWLSQEAQVGLTTLSSSSVRGCPGLSSSCKPSTQNSRERFRLLPAVLPVKPIRLEMAVLVSPAPQANTIYARSPIESGNDLEMAMLWSC